MSIPIDNIITTDSPVGRLEITSAGRHVTSLAIEHGGRLPHDDLPEKSNALLERAVQQLAEYFDGSRRTFSLPLAFSGTAFQRSVWQRMARLRWGECLSYGTLAVESGHPGAHRAVGAAVAANPIPLIVGCHRILSSNGRVIGYTRGEGIPTKLWLLAHEGVTLAA
jgi:methylated-DNA-[protein]-cysteine S-methyltransferase